MKWLLLLLFAALPIQWVLVRVPHLGQQHIYFLVLFAIGAVMLARLRVRAVMTFCSVNWPFVVGNAVLTAIWIATAYYHDFSLRVAVQEGTQLVLFVAVGTALFLVARSERGIEVLRWSGVVSNVTLLTGLTLSMLVNSINPLTVLGDTISSGDPGILERQLFKLSLVGFGYEADSLLSNIRHEIFAGVLVAALVSAIAVRLRPFQSRAAIWATRVSLAVSVALIVISLSRAVTIAMLVWPLLSVLRSSRLGRFTRNQVIAGWTVLLGVGLLTASGFAAVVWTRFAGDTTSYQKRDTLLSDALSGIASHTLTGGVDTRGESSHNFILDSWLRTGITGALAALFVTVALIGLFAALAMQLHREPEYMVPATAGLALVLVRLFTAGGGAIPPVEWVAMAVFAALLTRRAVHRTAPPPTSPRPPGRVSTDSRDRARAPAVRA